MPTARLRYGCGGGSAIGISQYPAPQRGELPPELAFGQADRELRGQQLQWTGTIVRTEAEIDRSSRMVS